MTNRKECILSRLRIERKYEELGLTDYKLRTLEQLKEIHGVDVNQISRYHDLPEEQKALFDKAIINFYNAWGLDSRKALKPQSVNYVYEITYYKQIEDTDDFFTDIGQEIYIFDGKKVSRRLHKYVFEKGIDFKSCEKEIEIYLRFELHGEWYHIISATEWY